MSDERKNSLKYSSAWILCVLFVHITVTLIASDARAVNFYNPLTSLRDTIPADTIPDSLRVRNNADSAVRRNMSDTLGPVSDSLSQAADTLNISFSKDTLDAPITYSASDSIVFIIPDKQIILFNKANIKQKDMDLSADSIGIDQNTNLVTATFRRDTSGAIVGRPKMVQGGTTMESDLIHYNTETQKGLTQQTITQQGEIYIQGEKVKKVSVSDFYAYRGQFTTCNLDTPHFAFRTKKMKLINQKLAVSGPVHPEFEGVPIPIYLPFGIFPISQGRHSGLLPPQFTASPQFGLGLQGLGYYKVISDNFDVLLRGDVYSYGGWAGYFQPEYRKRYRYNGRMLLTIQKTRILGSDPKEDFQTTRTFNINWSHSMDSKARPGTNFSANVNAGSTKFNRLRLNDPARNYANNLNSSITYSKTWDAANLTVSANHSQNSNGGLVNVSLPTVAFTANTIYPFQPKDFVGTAKWYQKLGIGLNSNFANRVSFYDSLFSFRNILDTMQWGAQHNVPIQLSLPPVGPVTVSPGISYSERWHSIRFQRVWNPNKLNRDSTIGGIDTSVTKGFYTSRDLSFSLSLSTAIFGMFDKFGKNSSVRAIRHVIRPTVALNYRPDLAQKDYYTTQITKDGRAQRFSYYEGSIYGASSEGAFGGVSFGVDNNVEMKVRSKKDTGDAAIKKVRLIDGFGINGSYNLISDSFRLSPLTMYVRSTLFEKINITAGATLDPYQVDNQGFRIDKYAWSGAGPFSPGRITNGNLAISTSFKSKPKDEKVAQQNEQLQDEYGPQTMDEQMAQLDYVRNNPGEFADFNVPWSLNVSYSLNFFRRFRADYSGFETDINSTLNLNGDFNLTPRWKMGLQTYYDLKTSSVQMLSMFITREMHCWQLSINVAPVGINRFFNITISPKSGILRDLKVNRTRNFYGG